MCTTTPCVTSCASYLGCECETSTVTDYYVSCTLSSCTTTSSAVVTGYVTASDYTTGEYCVSGVTVLSDDDQGQVGILTIHTGSLSTTLPESAVVSGTACTPTSGTIVVSGRTLTIPVVTSMTTEVVGGETVIIVPKATVKVAPSTTSSSTSTTTTTPAPEATLGVEGYSVLLEIDIPGGIPAIADFWAERDYTVGVSSNYPCSIIEENTLLQPGNAHYTNFPSSWAFTRPLHGYTSCTYLNTAAPKAAVGTLTCPDLPTKVSCPPTEGTYSCIAGADSLSFTALFHCHFY